MSNTERMLAAEVTTPGIYDVSDDDGHAARAKWLGGMWFRVDGKGDGVLWFRPKYAMPVEDNGGQANG